MSKLPLNFNSEQAKHEFYDIAKTLPEGIEVYLIGGALRNALFRHFHGEVLQQRDYDQIVTQGSPEYFRYLLDRGFIKGKIDRPTQKVFRKAMIGQPAFDDHEKWITFDAHNVDGTTPIENLRHHVGLTVNGFAIALRDTLSEDWQDKLITLPGALDDLEHKQLRVNKEGYKDQAANFFACLRFIHAGFAPPPNDEVQLLLGELPLVETGRYEANVQKVFSYVGGEASARKLVKDLGVDVDVFDEATIKSQR